MHMNGKKRKENILNGQKTVTILKNPDFKGSSLLSKISTKALDPSCLTVCMKQKACLGEYA